MGFLLGGLLSGLGEAADNYSSRIREDALAKLKRDQTLQDDATTEARTQQAGRQKFADDIVKLDYGEAIKKRENETEYDYKRRLAAQGAALKGGEQALQYKLDAGLARIRGQIDTNKDAASQRLKAQIDNKEVDSIHAADDGSTVVIFKNGRTEVNKTVKLRDTSADSGDGNSTIAAAAARKNGTAPPVAVPKGVASATPKVAGGMTMTQDDVNQTASEMNMTPAQALILLKARGYRLAN